jgi:hypothetical protein
LVHFENCGFEGAPRFLGIDTRGREILSFRACEFRRIPLGLRPPSGGLVDAMLTTVRLFQAVVAPPDRGVMDWGAA